MDPEPPTKSKSKPVQQKTIVTKPKKIIKKAEESNEPRKMKKRVHVEKSNAQLLANHKGIRQLFKQIGGTYNVHRVSKDAIDLVKVLHGEEKYSTTELCKIIQLSTQLANRREAKTVNDVDVNFSVSAYQLFCK